MLCPGSRSGPLASAAGHLASRGELRLTTAIDERSAGFLALGMATAAGNAVAVVTTSGTAVANLLPAVVEADRSTQPLLLLTADRPQRLKDCGANQTVNQERFLLPACRWCWSDASAGLHDQSVEQLLGLAQEAWTHAQGTAESAAGPVHLNLPFEEPLHASSFDSAEPLLPSAPLRTSGSTGDQAIDQTVDAAALPLLKSDQPGVVIAGPWRGLMPSLSSYRSAVRRWLEISGWPLFADPLAALPVDLPGRIHHWELLLESLPVPANCQVLRLGPLPASRRLESWLQSREGTQLLITEGEQRRLDALSMAQQWSGGVASWIAAQQQTGQSPPLDWMVKDQCLAEQLDTSLPMAGQISEPGLAYQLPRLLPEGLPVMLAASSPVRDWLVWSGSAGSDRRCFSFRGASGIDGTLSLAMGLSIELGPLTLLTGDLALLHDSNGWLLGGRDGPPLLVVLIDNGGGGIFEQIPMEPIPAEVFDRLFAMPQQVDPLALAAAHGVEGRTVSCLEELPENLAWGLAQGRPTLLRLVTDRKADAALRQTLRTAARNAEPFC